MAIVGFNFTKVHAERKKPVHGKININNNIAVLNVEDAQLAMAEKKKGVRLSFSFQSVYQPEIGTLVLEGNVILLEDAKVAEDVLQTWSKQKSLPETMMGGVLNTVLERCNIQALTMARDLGLPAPIPLPKVNVQKPAQAKPVAEKKKK